MAHCSCLLRGDWDRPQEVHRSRRAGCMWFLSLPESGERRSGLLSPFNRHSGKGHAPSSQACDRGGGGLAEGGTLGVTGRPWTLHMELTAPRRPHGLSHKGEEGAPVPCGFPSGTQRKLRGGCLLDSLACPSSLSLSEC